MSEVLRALIRNKMMTEARCEAFVIYLFCFVFFLLSSQISYDCFCVEI